MAKPVFIIQSYYFLDYRAKEGDKQPIGGGRRYLRDIGKLFFDLGYEVIYIQKADRDFHINFEGWAQVHGVKSPLGTKGDYIFSRKAYKLSEKADIICYGNMEDSFPYIRSNSFAIQHGIWWDYKIPKWKLKIQEKRVKYVASKVKFVVCVDTNFINWFRTKWPNEKDIYNNFHYIPNYANLEEFKPKEDFKENVTPTLLFPRRFEAKRGYHLFIEMCQILNSKGYRFNVEIIGAGMNNEQQEIEEKMKSLGIRTNIEEALFDSMAKYYQNAYLTYIPTLWSEGTSLSAVESIASGCPVITTDVGGLGNIILPGYNGDILPANAEYFAEVTAKLLDNTELRNEMAKNCINIRETFGKQRWDSKINQIVLKYFR